MGRKKGSFCIVCKETIKVQINKGTGICSENCAKKQKGESLVPKVLAMGAI